MGINAGINTNYANTTPTEIVSGVKMNANTDTPLMRKTESL